MEWKTVRIFISSTFNDMHAERDYLVKNVFPELREWCEERKLRLIDIDLRWGVSCKDTEAKNTVMACLNNIDESRPFFLCFLGQRRGWIPTLDDISNSTMTTYPEIEKFIGNNSVTEMEIEHALLSPMQRIVNGNPEDPLPVEHAFFFFRNNPFSIGVLNEAQENLYTNKATKDSQGADTALNNFKRKIAKTYPEKIFLYDCNWDKQLFTPELLNEGCNATCGRLHNFNINRIPLKNILLEQLKVEIQKEFPSHTLHGMQSHEELSKEQQEQYLSMHLEGYIEKHSEIEALDNYIESDAHNICVITADAGLGKTTLLANYIVRLKSRTQKIIYRFCGASDHATDLYSLWSGIFKEGGIICPPDYEYMRLHMAQLISELSGIVIIDGINQLPNGAGILTWLPKELPKNLKIIISIKNDDQITRFLNDNGNKFSIIRLKPLETDADKEAIINAYLVKYLKHFDKQHIEAVCHTANSSNPLYLKILLSELRVFGAFGRLEEEIKRYGNDTVSAFDAVLGTLENEAKYLELSSSYTVPLLFGLLACSRNGLTESELLLCFAKKYPSITADMIKEIIRLFLRRVRHFISQCNGKTDFLYESFKIAAGRRYEQNSQENNRLLASCFYKLCDKDCSGMFTCDNARPLTELVFHIKKYDMEAAAELLCNVSYLNTCCTYGSVAPLIAEYDDLPEGKAKRFQQLIIKNRDVLITYPNSFFSIALTSSDQIIQQTAQAICKQWTKPYIYQNKIFKCSQRKQASMLSMRIEASISLDKTVAVCQPKAADFALYSEGSGKIRLIYTDNMTIDDKAILTTLSRPLDIFSSDDGRFIAITHENETADIIELVFEDKKFLYSKTIKQINFYLPLYSDAVFAFSGYVLYYQSSDNTLKALDLSNTEKIPSTTPLPSSAEVNMLLPRDRDVLCAYQMDDESVISILKNDTLTEYLRISKLAITTACAIGSAKTAIAFSDSSLRIFTEDMVETTRIVTPCVCTLLINLPEGILGIGEATGDMVLLPHNKSELICSRNPAFQYRNKLSARYKNDVLSFISDLRVIKIAMCNEATPLKNITSLLCRDDLICISQEDDGFTYYSSDTEINIKGEYGKIIPIKNRNQILLFDTLGKFILLDPKSGTYQQYYPEHIPVSVVQINDGYYMFDIGGMLYHYPERALMPDLSEYMLGSVKLKSYGDKLILTGISTNAKAVNKNKAYLLLVYQTRADHTLKLLLERYFETDRGMFIDCSYNYNQLYVLFSTPNENGMKSKPSVSFGTIEEFADELEKRKELAIERKNVSSAATSNTLYICANEIIISYNAATLEYQAACKNENGYSLLICEKDIIYAAGNDGSVYEITNIN